jgi:hypothetical protein
MGDAGEVQGVGVLGFVGKDVFDQSQGCAHAPGLLVANGLSQ